MVPTWSESTVLDVFTCAAVKRTPRCGDGSTAHGSVRERGEGAPTSPSSGESAVKSDSTCKQQSEEHSSESGDRISASGPA